MDTAVTPALHQAVAPASLRAVPRAMPLLPLVALELALLVLVLRAMTVVVVVVAVWATLQLWEWLPRPPWSTGQRAFAGRFSVRLRGPFEL